MWNGEETTLKELNDRQIDTLIDRQIDRYTDKDANPSFAMPLILFKGRIVICIRCKHESVSWGASDSLSLHLPLDTMRS